MYVRYTFQNGWINLDGILYGAVLQVDPKWGFGKSQIIQINAI